MKEGKNDKFELSELNKKMDQILNEVKQLKRLTLLSAKELLTLQDTQELLGVKRGWVHTCRNLNLLEEVNINGKPFVTKRSITQHLEKKNGNEAERRIVTESEMVITGNSEIKVITQSQQSLKVA
jgi:hypothetical protein